MGASTFKVATYYEQVVRKKVGCRIIVSKKEVTWEWETFGGCSYFGRALCNNNLLKGYFQWDAIG